MSVEQIQMNKYYKRLNKTGQAIMLFLIENGNTTPIQLQTTLALTERQVRYNIRLLREKKFITVRPNINDMRGVTYGVHDNVW